MNKISHLVVMLLLTASVMAQVSNPSNERQKRWEELKAKRAAFFTERIGLTPEEAQLFWPVYNSLQEEKGKLNAKLWNLHHKGNKNKKTDQPIDYLKLTQEMVNLKVQEANLEKVYYQKFKKILPPEKLFRFYITDRDWGTELLKQMQRRGDQH
jgi:hypothetical protein